MPIVNSAAAATKLELFAAQLEDAVEECLDLLKDDDEDDNDDDDDDDDDGWDELAGPGGASHKCTESEKAWITDALTMVKTTKLTVKKLASTLSKLVVGGESGARINRAIDQIVELAARCVVVSDDLVGEIDFPLDDVRARLDVAVQTVARAEEHLLAAANIFVFTPQLVFGGWNELDAIFVQALEDNRRYLQIESSQIASQEKEECQPVSSSKRRPPNQYPPYLEDL
eukprot:jgi/Hompol1/7114/HPOL_005191-RA